MQIKYKSKKLERLCCDKQFASKKYGIEMWNYLFLRITQIKAASSLEEMVHNHIGGCHKLKGNRQDQYAFHLQEPNRLIVVKIKNSSENSVEIIEIVDYH